MNKKIKELSIYGGTSLGWLEDAEEVEKKDLLLQDLCARLPYSVIVYDYDKEETREMGLGTLHDIMFNDLECKPYLRPMSSMTEDECKKLGELPATIENISEILPNTPYFIEVVRPEQIDWLNKRMFDYHGLIERGLALEAQKGMYNLEKE